MRKGYQKPWTRIEDDRCVLHDGSCQRTATHYKINLKTGRQERRCRFHLDPAMGCVFMKMDDVA